MTVADGTTKQARLNLKWSVTDPNGDDLEYTLHIRKEAWPDWVRLGDESLTSSSFEWDTTAVPAGLLPRPDHRERPPLQQPQRRLLRVNA